MFEVSSEFGGHHEGGSGVSGAGSDGVDFILQMLYEFMILQCFRFVFGDLLREVVEDSLFFCQ